MTNTVISDESEKDGIMITIWKEDSGLMCTRQIIAHTKTRRDSESMGRCSYSLMHSAYYSAEVTSAK